MTTTWRLLLDPPATGAVNMARDETLLESAIAGGVPTVRFYGWQPACLSLGSLQAFKRAARQPAGTAGIDVVRRPTGGRALLHDDEVTYAVAAPGNHPLVCGGIGPAYRRIAEALAAGLRELGVPDFAIAPARRPGSSGPACYDTASDFEIQVGGRKLIGSAQLRRPRPEPGGVLQHGSIPLRFDAQTLLDRLPVDGSQRDALAQSLAEHATGLKEHLSGRLAREDVIAALCTGFRRYGVELEPGEWRQEERDRVQFLTAKYQSREWTERR